MKTKTYKYGVEDLREELDEIDAEIDELQALHAASLLADSRHNTALYEEDVLVLKEDIGELRDVLEEASEVADFSVREEHQSILSRATARLRDIRTAFHELRRQFFYQF